MKRINKPHFVTGNNFMTPTALAYYEIDDDYVVELSKGEGLSRNTLYGVTVWTKKGEHTDLSRPFSSRSEAMDYIAELNNQTVEV